MNRKRPANPLASPTWLQFVPAVALGAFALLYLAWFYWPTQVQDSLTPAAQFRLVSASFAFAPEQLVRSWLGDGEHLALLDRLPIVGVALLILFSALGWGGRALRGGRLAAELTRLEHLVFATALGLSLLSLLTLAVGLAGGLHQAWLFWLVLLGGGGIAVWDLRTTTSIANVETNARENLVGWIALAVFAAVILLGAMLPPWDFDVREYHLQTPKEWFQHGRITFLPHNIYANMPLGAEMHGLLAMAIMPGERGWWYGALAGKTVMAAFSLITALSLVTAGQRFLGSTWAGFAAGLVYLAHPWIVHTAIQGLNEPAVAAYSWLAVYTCLVAVQGVPSLRWLALAGFFAGSAAACKYPALLFLATPLGVWIGSQSLSRKQFAPLAAFVLAAALAGGPWLAKNWILTGNPTYPLLVSVFDGATRTTEKDAQWRKAHQVPGDSLARKYSLASLMHTGRLLLVDSEYLSPLVAPLIAGLGIAIVAGRLLRGGADSSQSGAQAFPPQAQGAIVAVGGMLLFHLAVWWLATHRIDRFWVPALPYAAFLAGAGVVARPERAWRWTASGLLALGLLLSLLFVASPAVGDNRWFVALDALRIDGATKAGDILRLNPAHAWLNTHVQPGEAVLLVGDAQPFDLEVPAFYSTCFDDCLLVAWMGDRSAAERRSALGERQIGYVLIDWGEIERYRSPGNYGFPTGMTRELVEELVTQKVLAGPLPALPSSSRELYRVVREAAP